jgi:acyl transferase domain-containing protein/thioesterase domain-containing protein/acyl carrier protein
MSSMEEESGDLIAVVGMACRFPGADSPERYWENIRDGVESIRSYTDEELLAAGVRRAELDCPNYVKRGAPIEKMEHFDAEFFGFGPQDAAIMDPQHRALLECAWEALESAGHPPDGFDGSIGVYAGCGMNSYFIQNLASNPELVDSVGYFLLRHTGNDKDFLATRISYCLDLKGPSINVQTACSTSLVAIHEAASSLLALECDMALAGGVTFELPHRQGYLYAEGEILSPDGRCRAFDHRAQGTVFGSGAGMVVLRRLQDALDDGDPIIAVLRGSAVNNDGSGKVGYLAPSVDGQAAAVAEALEVAGIDADAISYVEAHGTGTPTGDPIELAALTQAFSASTHRRGYCGIGSVKTNIGHLDTAAGVASFIKVCKALQHRQLPPSLHLEAPNAALDIEQSPFFIVERLRDWTSEEPLRASVNSLGVGGTNAHVVLEEAPEVPASAPSEEPFHALLLSGRNAAALAGNASRLAAHLTEEPELELADVAYTLDVGRKAFGHRAVAVVSNHADAVELLSSRDSSRWTEGKASAQCPSVAFLFPGGGAQYVGMARDLYEADAEFRTDVDRGLSWLREEQGLELGPLLFADESRQEAAAAELLRPSLQLPAIFIVEYALAALWRRRGVEPSALLGHSMGENTAACLAGVMSFEDCLGLVSLRGRLFEKTAGGGMLSVALPEEQLRPYLGDSLSLACKNGPKLFTVSGPEAAIAALVDRLEADDVDFSRIRIDVAAHSSMLDGILEEFRAHLSGLSLRPPEIPVLSNRSGDWLTAEEATDPEYWVQHLRSTVCFAQCVDRLLEEPGRLLLEVGPGTTLGSLAKQSRKASNAALVTGSLRHPKEKLDDRAQLLRVAGQLWCAGFDLDWSQFRAPGRRRRLPLPTYAFQRQRYFIEPGRVPAHGSVEGLHRIEKPADRFYEEAWKLRDRPEPSDEQSKCWLVFVDSLGCTDALIDSLKARGKQVVTVRQGNAFRRLSEDSFVLDPERGPEGYARLAAAIAKAELRPDRVVHAWLYSDEPDDFQDGNLFQFYLERGFYGVLYLVTELSKAGLLEGVAVDVISSGMQAVGDEKLACPNKATVLGPLRVLPKEYEGLQIRSIDLPVPVKTPRRGFLSRSRVASPAEPAALLAELLARPRACMLALRGELCFEQTHVSTPVREGDAASIKEGGVYLITGGLGGIGFALARRMASRGCRLAIVGRTALPKRAQRETWLRLHGSDDSVSLMIRRVQELENLGAEVLLTPADVSDPEAMKAVLQTIEGVFGRVDGVIHAAGLLRDGLAETKTADEIGTVLAPKAHGARVLDTLFADRRLDFFVTCSSTSTAIGPAGQVDYVAANAYLNAHAKLRRAEGHPVTALNWGIWAELGMAASAAAEMLGAKRSKVFPGATTKFPLFSAREETEEGQTRFVGTLSSRRHWLLDGHRMADGRALVPGTGFVQLVTAAMAELVPDTPIRIQNLSFLSPLDLDDDEERMFRVVLRQEGSGTYSAEVQSTSGLDGASRDWELHAEGEVKLLRRSRDAKYLPVASIEERCRVLRLGDGVSALRSEQERHIRFGPRWSVLRRVAYGKGEALAELSLSDEFADEVSDFSMHPALLDLATGYAMRLIEGYEGSELWVPMTYRSIKVSRSLPAKVLSWVRNVGHNAVCSETATFDISIATTEGELVASIEGFSLRRLSAGMQLGRDDEARTGVKGPRSKAPSALLSPAQRAFQNMLSMGITPAEGVQAFETIISSPEVSATPIYTSIDLPSLARQSEASVRSRETSLQLERPELESQYLAPRDRWEEAIAQMWSSLLGVDRVGVQDSFFDLGGHSLIAVRLFNLVRREFGVELAISALFEAPTVESLAALLRDELGAADTQSGTPKIEVRKKTKSTVVAIRSSGSLPPIFCAAGMGGNPMNLRHLAHYLGDEQPFYGFQHRGTDGSEAPHESVQEMAAEYLKDMREVQPHGPYYIGGFSGGGTAAYELAQQLARQGEAVGLLFMLDSVCPAIPERSRRERLRMHTLRLREEGASYAFGKVVDGAGDVIGSAKEAFVRPLAKAFPYQFRNDHMRVAWVRAESRYVPKPYRAGPVHLFRVSHEERSMGTRLRFDDSLGWAELVSDLEVTEVLGDHESMCREPYVRHLATELICALDLAQREAAE